MHPHLMLVQTLMTVKLNPISMKSRMRMMIMGNNISITERAMMMEMAAVVVVAEKKVRVWNYNIQEDKMTVLTRCFYPL